MLPCRSTSLSKANCQNTLFPGLTNFRHTSPSRRSNRDHGLQRELSATGTKRQARRTVATDSRVVNCNRFSYQQVIHILLHRKLAKANSTEVRAHKHKCLINCSAQHIPCQYILSDRHINNTVQCKLVILWWRHTRLCPTNAAASVVLAFNLKRYRITTHESLQKTRITIVLDSPSFALHKPSSCKRKLVLSDQTGFRRLRGVSHTVHNFATFSFAS